MKRQEFLERLGKRLSWLPQGEIAERLAFYNEMIEDQMEDGVSEEEAVARIGSVDEIVSRIVEETSFAKIAKEQMKEKRKLKVWEIILLILGSPIWGSLLIALLAVAFSLYAALWSIIVSIWAAELSFLVSSFGAIILSPIYAVQGHEASAAIMVSCGFALAGLSIFSFFGCKAATKGIIWLTKKMVTGMKRLILKGEKSA